MWQYRSAAKILGLACSFVLAPLGFAHPLDSANWTVQVAESVSVPAGNLPVQRSHSVAPNGYLLRAVTSTPFNMVASLPSPLAFAPVTPIFNANDPNQQRINSSGKIVARFESDLLLWDGQSWVHALAPVTGVGSYCPPSIFCDQGKSVEPASLTFWLADDGKVSAIAQVLGSTPAEDVWQVVRGDDSGTQLLLASAPNSVPKAIRSNANGKVATIEGLRVRLLTQQQDGTWTTQWLLDPASDFDAIYVNDLSELSLAEDGSVAALGQWRDPSWPPSSPAISAIFVRRPGQSLSWYFPPPGQAWVHGNIQSSPFHGDLAFAFYSRTIGVDPDCFRITAGRTLPAGQMTPGGTANLQFINQHKVAELCVPADPSAVAVGSVLGSIYMFTGLDRMGRVVADACLVTRVAQGTSDDFTQLDQIIRFVPTDNCRPDFNRDGVVDASDFLIFAQAYAEVVVPPAASEADLNSDGLVDSSDFVAFVGFYNEFLCP